MPTRNNEFFALDISPALVVATATEEGYDNIPVEP